MCLKGKDNRECLGGIGGAGATVHRLSRETLLRIRVDV